MRLSQYPFNQDSRTRVVLRVESGLDSFRVEMMRLIPAAGMSGEVTKFLLTQTPPRLGTQSFRPEPVIPAPGPSWWRIKRSAAQGLEKKIRRGQRLEPVLTLRLSRSGR